MPKPRQRVPKTVRDGALQDPNLIASARELWQTTDLSLNDIARRLGIRAKTTISRWKKRAEAEGEPWIRDLAEIRGERVAKALGRTHAGARAEIQGELETTEDFDEAGPSCDRNDPTGKSGHTPKAAPAKGPMPPQGRQTLSDDAVSRLEFGPDTELAKNLTTMPMADLHAITTRRQLNAASRLQDAALFATDQIIAIMAGDLAPDGDGDRSQFEEAKARLGALGAESLSSIIRSTALLMATAVTIERRAMGLDANTDWLQDSRRLGAQAYAVPQDAAALYEHMPTEVLNEMLAVSKKAQQVLLKGPTQGTVIDGTAQPTKEPKDAIQREANTGLGNPAGPTPAGT